MKNEFFPHNEPIPSTELLILRQLISRKELPEHEKQKYTYLEKGYEGQVKFNQLLQTNLSINHIRLNDLLLKQNNTEFQLDLTLLLPNKIYLFEVKNLVGDYIVKGDDWTSLSGTEISNPVLQLTRSKSLFRRLLQTVGGKITLEAYVVFVNPEFTLYNASPTLPIILPTQLNRLLTTLNKNAPLLNPSYTNIATKLVERHLPKSSNEKLPEYNYDELKKGIVCPKCGGFMEGYNQKALMCKRCRSKEDINHAVLRSIKEINLLFPNLKITTKTVCDWCSIIGRTRIKRVLLTNFKLIKNGKYSYYSDLDK